MNDAGYLLLEDGRRFNGRLRGRVPLGLPTGNADPGIGEVVFQTGMSGYQEVITDPSYRGQIVTFTASHIGNTGINLADEEAPAPALAGIVTRSLSDTPSSWRSEGTLPDYLERHRLPCLTEVDTRALTRHLREAGALRGLLAPAGVDETVALARVRAFPGLTGRDLVREVAPEATREFTGSSPVSGEDWTEEFPFRGRDGNGGLVGAGKRITLVHCGMKTGIDDCLRHLGASVRIVNPAVSVEELRAGKPDGIFLSNGPGDPDALETLIATIRAVIGTIPVQGICLGHQVLALALGAKTYKMKFGHHGINHPVRDLATGGVLVTSQNHGFAVDRESLKVGVGGDRKIEAIPTHESLYDGVLEGFAVPELRVQAVQFHPEARGGPHDARSLFARFLEALPGTAGGGSR
jgi:carbamoyl-phosphate synthase small subunit